MSGNFFAKVYVHVPELFLLRPLGASNRVIWLSWFEIICAQRSYLHLTATLLGSIDLHALLEMEKEMGWPILRLERGKKNQPRKGSGLGDNGRGQQALSEHERRRERGLQFSSFFLSWKEFEVRQGSVSALRAYSDFGRGHIWSCLKWLVLQ